MYQFKVTVHLGAADPGELYTKVGKVSIGLTSLSQQDKRLRQHRITGHSPDAVSVIVTADTQDETEALTAIAGWLHTATAGTVSPGWFRDAEQIWDDFPDPETDNALNKFKRAVWDIIAVRTQPAGGVIYPLSFAQVEQIAEEAQQYAQYRVGAPGNPMRGGELMAKRYGRPSAQYRYEHYDPRW